MSIRRLKLMALLLIFGSTLDGLCLRAQTIDNGNLTVTGSNVYMGSQASTTNPGWAMFYTDGTNSYVDFEAARYGNTWSWVQNGSSQQMTLDNTNTVRLFNTSGTISKITLSPTGTSSFASSVIISGTDNEMPNQTLVNGNSILTESLANSLFLAISRAGNVGIETTNPQANLNVVGSSVIGDITGIPPGLSTPSAGQSLVFNSGGSNYTLQTSNSNSAIGPGVICKRAEGTSASPSQVQAGDLIMGLYAYPVDSRNTWPKVSGWPDRVFQRL